MIITQNSVLSGAPTPQELELINSYTVKPLKAEEVYTFGIVLCDNEIDRDFERFDIPALEKLTGLFVGKTGIFDHSMSGRDQTARIFSCRVETDENKVTSAGEKYTKLCARAYMPRSEKNAALIEEIDAGIKKETSVGCSVGRSVCSVCGKDGRTEPCAHIKGREYGGKLCHRILCDPTDAYEWSFVAVPAQPAAGVTKSYRADEQTVKTVKRLSCANGGMTLTKAEAAGTLRLHRRAREARPRGQGVPRGVNMRCDTHGCGGSARYARRESLSDMRHARSRAAQRAEKSVFGRRKAQQPALAQKYRGPFGQQRVQNLKEDIYVSFN